MDVEGYGARPGQAAVDRLIEDCRTLSPAGIERVASGWERHSGDGFSEAEKAALHVLEQEGRGAVWDELRTTLLGLTERGTPLISWRAEHGDIGHKAERALFGAALAILAGPKLDRRHSQTLRRPLAEALPWLLESPA